MFKKVLSIILTEIRCIERSVPIKELNNQNLWNFEIGSQKSMIVPLWVTTGFQQGDRRD